MAKKKETKQSPMQRLFVYAGKYKYLTIASWILATISAFVALVPFYFILAHNQRGTSSCAKLCRCRKSVGLWMECGWICDIVHAYLYRSFDLFAFVRISRTGKYKGWSDETYFNAATWFYG